MTLHKNISNEQNIVIKTNDSPVYNKAFNKQSSRVAISTLQPTVVITDENVHDGNGVYDPGNTQPFATLTITFSEYVKDFVVGDISTGGPAGTTLNNFTQISRDVYTVEISNSTGGADIEIDINASVCTDLSGNNNLAAIQHVITEI